MTQVGRTFGRVADVYQGTRPEYTDEVVGRAVEELRLPPTATVLDLAAGTGKLTRALRERFDRVIAVEPDDAMRAHIVGESLRGSAEEIPLADGSVDAVFVADAFHWFDAPQALREIVRVARPGGGLAVLGNDWWGAERPPMPPEARAILDALFHRFHPNGGAYHQAWIDVLQETVGPVGRASFVREEPYAGRALAELLLTSSSPAPLSDDERAEFATRFVPLFAGDYVLEVKTELFWTTLR